MGNRHGAEKPAREDKEEKRKKKKEKKAKKKSKKKTAAGSDVDLDPESSHFSRADSESMVFHSAENLSPYLDASTRSEEGAACTGFHDNGHILSSKDFHDGFSIEACLPADLAASGLMSDVTGDVTKAGDDVASMASGGYSTPLLSSPDVRRGLPRSPLAQRQKDSFLEPVPPIPSDFSSNTLSSVSYQEGVSSPCTDRSSSRASSSTVDTNAAHCIERLEELERNIKRTIIEKFAPFDSSSGHAGPHRGDDTEESSEGSSPLLARRRLQRDFETGDRSRDGSVTPRGAGPGGAPSRSVENSPAPVRKTSEPCRPFQKEGSTTPKGIIQGVWSQSAENSPVIVRRALPNPESPVIMRRTPSQSPTAHRKFPANAPESSALLRQGAESPAASPRLSPSVQRVGAGPAGHQDTSPRFVRKAPEASAPAAGVIKPPPHRSAVPPPVPPKPCKTLTSPDVARRAQNMPKSPIMPRKVYAFQEPRAKESGRSAFSERDDPLDRSRRENQMPPRSPSRSPEVRHRVAARKTPSSSPSPKSLGRKLMPLEDRAPPPVPLATSPPTPIQFCEQKKGVPVKRCIVSAQPSTAVVLATGTSQESLQSVNGADAKAGQAGPAESSLGKDSREAAAAKDTKDSQTKGGAAKDTQARVAAQPHRDKAAAASDEAVSEDTIKQNTESAVFGSVSPKLKRQKKISSSDEVHQKGSLEASCSSSSQRTDRFDNSPLRSPPSSPPLQRGVTRRPSPSACKPSVKINVIKYKGTEPSAVCVVPAATPAERQGAGGESPRARRAQYVAQTSSSKNSKDEGTLSADIAGGLTYHTHLASELTGGDDTCDVNAHGVVGSEPEISSGQPPALYASILRKDHAQGSQKQPTPTADRKVIEGSTVYNAGATTTLPPPPTTTLVSQKTLQLVAQTTAPNAAPPHDRGQEIPHRALIAGATVARNAAGKTENAGRETFSHDTARFDERVRASPRRTEESERSPAVGAQCEPLPPPLPETVSSSNGTSKAIGRNLGQRIRDVINESAFREVFTAELSSSSLEKEDVTYTSDDSVFAPTAGTSGSGGGGGGGQGWNSPAQSDLHGNFRTQAEDESQLVDRQSSGVDSSGSSPKTKRAKAAAATLKKPTCSLAQAEQGRTRAEDATATTQPSLAAVSSHTHGDKGRAHADFLVPSDTTAIRRIDVDVSVTLPRAAPLLHGETINSSGSNNNAAAAAATAATARNKAAKTATASNSKSSSGKSVKCTRRAVGQAPEMMDSSVDPLSDFSHSSPPVARTTQEEGEEEEEEEEEKEEKGTKEGSATGGTGKQAVEKVGRQSKSQEKKETSRHPLPPQQQQQQQQQQQRRAMQTAHGGSEAESVLAKESKDEASERGEKEKVGKQKNAAAVHSNSTPPSPSSSSTLPTTTTPAPVSRTASAEVKKSGEGGGGSGRKEEQSREGAAAEHKVNAEERTFASKTTASRTSQTNKSLDNAITGGSATAPTAATATAATATAATAATTATVTVASNDPAGGVKLKDSKTVPATDETAEKTQRSGTTTTTTQAEPSAPKAADSSSKHALPCEPPARETSHSQHARETTVKESVPPPSPSAMDVLAEEEAEEEEEDVDGMVDAHQDSDISSRISEEMKMFGETVVKRLSSLLESQASESDSCVEEGRSDLLKKQRSKSSKGATAEGDNEDGDDDQRAPSQNAPEASSVNAALERNADCETSSGGAHRSGDGKDLVQDAPPGGTDAAARKKDTEPVLHEELNTFSSADLPGERLVTSDTTETLSTDHETSASSKRESTTSTATDETLTSFKTRSTTDSAEFEEAFVLPESLVFVRRVKEEADYDEDGSVVVESGRIIKRPPIPAELTVSGEASESSPHKPRKKRRRQVGSYDVSAKSDVTEPVPKRGSKQIRDVIDAYCDEVSDESDLSSSTDDVIREGVVQTSTFNRSEHQPPAKLTSFTRHEDDGVRDIVRRPRPPADRSTDSSDESEDLLVGQRRSASSQDSSFRIPEIEETFGELMGVKTFLDDLEDKTPTSEPIPVFLGSAEPKSKEFWSASHYRRSRTSPAKTDRTESDLDISEQRDDASTDSMYADDEDEGAEVLFQRSYSEEHGGEVVLSCTIYNSAHDNDGDSDVYWADPEVAEVKTAEETYKTIETAADAAGSAFQNARIQMHDIHQHLQDLRRQMELLQEDITSTSLTLTPDYSLESEHRPLTE